MCHFCDFLIFCFKFSVHIHLLLLFRNCNKLFGRKDCQCTLTNIGWPSENILILVRCSVALSILLLETCHAMLRFRPGYLWSRSIQFLFRRTDLVSLSLYTAFSNLVRTSISSFMCSLFEPFGTTMISSNHVGCFYSSVWLFFS